MSEPKDNCENYRYLNFLIRKKYNGFNKNEISIIVADLLGKIDYDQLLNRNYLSEKASEFNEISKETIAEYVKNLDLELLTLRKFALVKNLYTNWTSSNEDAPASSYAFYRSSSKHINNTAHYLISTKGEIKWAYDKEPFSDDHLMDLTKKGLLHLFKEDNKIKLEEFIELLKYHNVYEEEMLEKFLLEKVSFKANESILVLEEYCSYRDEQTSKNKVHQKIEEV